VTKPGACRRRARLWEARGGARSVGPERRKLGAHGLRRPERKEISNIPTHLFLWATAALHASGKNNGSLLASCVAIRIDLPCCTRLGRPRRLSSQQRRQRGLIGMMPRTLVRRVRRLGTPFARAGAAKTAHPGRSQCDGRGHSGICQRSTSWQRATQHTVVNTTAVMSPWVVAPATAWLCAIACVRGDPGGEGRLLRGDDIAPTRAPDTGAVSKRQMERMSATDTKIAVCRARSQRKRPSEGVHSRSPGAFTGDDSDEPGLPGVGLVGPSPGSGGGG